MSKMILLRSHEQYKGWVDCRDLGSLHCLHQTLARNAYGEKYQHTKSLFQWPLCMITSDEQISPPSLVCKENSLHLHSFCVDILFKFTALGHSFMQNFATLQFKTRLGGEICSLDVNMHKGYCPL